MNVVLYARVSTEKQAKKDLSIPEQTRQMEFYCIQKGHRVVKIYREEGASARDEKRPVFQDMIYEVLLGTIKVEAIIVYSRSRFFRDAFKAKYYEKKLEKKGVKLISLMIPTENLNTPTENLFKNMEDTLSQFQSDINALYTLAGMKANARKGYFNGGIPPFGYRIKRVQDEHDNLKSVLKVCSIEANTVQLIFELYVQKSYGAKRIASTLNKMGIAKRNGRKWTKDNVLWILHDTTYKGERIFNRYSSKTKKEKPKNELVKVKVEPIIDEDTFDQAQRILKENSPKTINPAIVSSPTLLTGILKCGLCGKSMTLETAKGGEYRYYNCRNYLREGSCPGQRIPVKIMDEEVLEHLTSKFFSVKRLSLILRHWMKEVKLREDYGKEEKIKIQSEIRKEKQKLNNIWNAIQNGVVTEENINPRIEQIKGNIYLLEEKLNKIRKLGKLSLPSYVFSVPFLQGFQQRIVKIFYEDTSFTKRYLKLFLDKIKVNGKNVTLIARSDILLRALSIKDEGNLEKVLTAGGVWLPGQDSNLQPSGYSYP